NGTAGSPAEESNTQYALRNTRNAAGTASSPAIRSEEKNQIGLLNQLDRTALLILFIHLPLGHRLNIYHVNRFFEAKQHKGADFINLGDIEEQLYSVAHATKRGGAYLGNTIPLIMDALRMILEENRLGNFDLGQVERRAGVLKIINEAIAEASKLQVLFQGALEGNELRAQAMAKHVVSKVKTGVSEMTELLTVISNPVTFVELVNSLDKLIKHLLGSGMEVTFNNVLRVIQEGTLQSVGNLTPEAAASSPAKNSLGSVLYYEESVTREGSGLMAGYQLFFNEFFRKAVKGYLSSMRQILQNFPLFFFKVNNYLMPRLGELKARRFSLRQESSRVMGIPKSSCLGVIFKLRNFMNPLIHYLPPVAVISLFVLCHWSGSDYINYAIGFAADHSKQISACIGLAIDQVQSVFSLSDNWLIKTCFFNFLGSSAMLFDMFNIPVIPFKAGYPQITLPLFIIVLSQIDITIHPEKSQRLLSDVSPAAAQERPRATNGISPVPPVV
ncbi:MAG: hypothetical protein NT066_06325, partial [Candidatus Omnitrophica bacterium]|nr:hypothetical protein [Candidatus Omnitrophota bacterium]